MESMIEKKNLIKKHKEISDKTTQEQSGIKRTINDKIRKDKIRQRCNEKKKINLHTHVQEYHALTPGQSYTLTDHPLQLLTL